MHLGLSEEALSITGSLKLSVNRSASPKKTLRSYSWPIRQDPDTKLPDPQAETNELRPASGANSSVPSPAHSNARLTALPGSHALQSVLMLTESILTEGTVAMWALPLVAVPKGSASALQCAG